MHNSSPLPITTRPAAQSDIADLLPRLRPQDTDEIRAVSGLAPEVVLPSALDRSATALMLGGTVEALYGCLALPHDRTIGTPWLVSSPNLFRNEQTIQEVMSESERLIRKWHETYRTLLVISDPKNVIHAKQLLWLGFVASGELVGVGGRNVFLLTRSA